MSLLRYAGALPRSRHWCINFLDPLNRPGNQHAARERSDHAGKKGFCTRTLA